MLHEIQTIQQFYAAMQETGKVRRRLVACILGGGSPDPADSKQLSTFLHLLRGIPRSGSGFQLPAGRSPSDPLLHLDFDYEIGELEKDLVFLEKGEQGLLGYLAELHPGFEEELAAAAQFCSTMHLPLDSLISDRDGTVNNYCGRYLSSIQSAYNAVFLSRFAKSAVRQAVLLTSAPLSDGGLVDLTVSPPGTFLLAGSKGREYLDKQGRRGALAVEVDKQRSLEKLNRRLTRLLQDPRYQLFGLIGSGLQFKFGQTTIARQDIHASIPESESQEFAAVIQELIREIDPSGRDFRTEDTGKDIEIILTVEGDSGLKDFDKGDGVLFLDAQLGLGLHTGEHLVCGDTSSDVRMVTAVAEKTPDQWTIFVTGDPELQQRVRQVCDRTHFVSKPDVLVCLLNNLAKEQG